jgi:acetolactate synthase-1/2/3 large subunit
VRIDVDPEYLCQGVEPHFAIHGSPLSVLTDIVEDAQDRELAPKKAWFAEASQRNKAFRERWTGSLPQAPAMTGQHLVEALRPLLDDQTLFLVDGGNIGQWAHMLLGDRYPGHWLTCGASGVIGWGIGGSIAARLVYPDRPVVLLSGDGSFGFTLGDLETAVRHCTPFVAVVADDRAWGIVASGQERRGRELFACELGPVRYDLVAEGLGALGLRAETPEEVTAAVRQGIASGRPTVVHVPITRGGPAD